MKKVTTYSGQRASAPLSRQGSHGPPCELLRKAKSTRTSRSRMLSAQRDVQQDQWMHFNAWLVQILQF